MFKTALIAATTVTLAHAGINGDFLSGFQTGVTTTHVDDFEDYQCPEPEVDPKVDQMKGMFKMAKGMMANKHNKDGDKD